MKYLSIGCTPIVLATALLAGLSPAQALQFSIVANVRGGPYIGAVRGATLYGVLPYIGSGTLFSLTTSGAYTLLHNFNSSTDGSTPNGLLAVDSGGNIFGTTGSGGSQGGGTVWEFSAGRVMSTLHALGAAGDGSVPMAGPVLGSDGNLYATAGEGAINDSGDVFRQTPGGPYKILYKFLSGADGHCPFSGVVRGKLGALYGTAVGHGAGGNPNGSIWKLSKALKLSTLYVFKNGTDGEWPDQTPAVDKLGNLYGTTHVQNGNNFAGAIWTISALGKFSVLHALTAATDGFAPNSPLLLNANGNLYGTTGSGGAHGLGTVFQVTPSGSFTVLHSFANTGDGAAPTGNLVHDSKGAIYGGTQYGPVFKIVP